MGILIKIDMRKMPSKCDGRDHGKKNAKIASSHQKSGKEWNKLPLSSLERY